MIAAIGFALFMSACTPEKINDECQPVPAGDTVYRSEDECNTAAASAPRRVNMLPYCFPVYREINEVLEIGSARSK